ncbi:MAG: hypothetical protein PHO45_02165, partial [Victivallaceae bacterium]|nr:hypothetical protein [Victivallaceae bacterium]
MNSPKKIGLIGVGGRGRHCWKAHDPQNGWEIIAGADINPAAQNYFMEHVPSAKMDFSEDY